MLSGMNKDHTILSLDLNQDEDEIITEHDEPSYTRLTQGVNLTFVNMQITVFNIYPTLVELLGLYWDYPLHQY